MISLQASTAIVSCSSTTKTIIKNTISGSKYLKYPRITVPKLPNQSQNHIFIEDLHKLKTNLPSKETKQEHSKNDENNLTKIKLYTVLEAINDRIEMHQNISEQRANWNSLLLNSVNMITLTAVTMAGLAEASDLGHGSALRVSSTLLFLAGTGVVLIMNKIQPSQLVEEQRNAVRLLKQLKASIETRLLIRAATQDDVDEAFERVLALDKAYPLPLLGAMLEKYPDSLKPAVWWPAAKKHSSSSSSSSTVQCSKHGDEQNNGWSVELENEMNEVIRVTKKKDIEDFVALGNKALQLSKVLGVFGPVLSGVAAVGAGVGGQWGGVVTAVAGSMAAAVNTIEHGGQVGMVFEMYRNCAGFFKLLEQTVESTLEEGDLKKREDGEIFELKMALNLGRSIPELRDLADKSRKNGGHVDQFASKLI